MKIVDDTRIWSQRDHCIEVNLLGDDEERLLQVVDGLILTKVGMFVGMLINMPEENDHTQFVTDDALFDYIVDNANNDAGHA